MHHFDILANIAIVFYSNFCFIASLEFCQSSESDDEATFTIDANELGNHIIERLAPLFKKYYFFIVILAIFKIYLDHADTL